MAETEVQAAPESMPLGDLKAMIDSSPQETVEPDPAPATEEQAPEVTEEQEPETPEAEDQAEAAPAKPADPEALAKSLRDEKIDLLVQQHEDLRKKYGELQKHSSRLASQLGRSRREPDQVEEDQDDTRVPEVLEERLSRLEERQNKEAVRGAIAEEFGRFDSKPEVQALELGPEISKVASRYHDRVLALSDLTDPAEARLLAREIALNVLTEAISERVKANTSRATEAAATAPARIAAKRASAALSNTGGKRATTRTAAPNPTTMPLNDLKELIEATRPE